MINFVNDFKKNTLFGPYSSAVKVGNFFFTSGHIPINTKNQKIPTKIYDQTYLTLKNIKNLLKQEKIKIKNIFKITIFTTKIEELNEINLSYKKFFDKYNKNYPVRTCIGVNKLPKNVSIEIEAIAYI